LGGSSPTSDKGVGNLKATNLAETVKIDHGQGSEWSGGGNIHKSTKHRRRIEFPFVIEGRGSGQTPAKKGKLIWETVLGSSSYFRRKNVHQG